VVVVVAVAEAEERGVCERSVQRPAEVGCCGCCAWALDARRAGGRAASEAARERRGEYCRRRLVWGQRPRGRRTRLSGLGRTPPATSANGPCSCRVAQPKTLLIVAMLPPAHGTPACYWPAPPWLRRAWLARIAARCVVGGRFAYLMQGMRIKHPT